MLGLQIRSLAIDRVSILCLCDLKSVQNYLTMKRRSKTSQVTEAWYYNQIVFSNTKDNFPLKMSIKHNIWTKVLYIYVVYFQQISMYIVVDEILMHIAWSN